MLRICSYCFLSFSFLASVLFERDPCAGAHPFATRDPAETNVEEENDGDRTTTKVTEVMGGAP